MIRNLKVLMAAAMALAAFSVLAQAAQAAPKFTAPGVGAAETTITLQPDEAAATKTAHHVFDITNEAKTAEFSITCNELTGDGVVKGESTESITITPHYGKTNAKGEFETLCNFGGQEVPFSTGACDFKFTASGLLHVETDTGLTGECKIGKNPVSLSSAALQCTLEIGAQTIEGVKFHEGPERGNPKKKTITLEANNLAFEYTAFGTGCPYGVTKNGLYTTGNTIVTGSKKGSVAEPEMVGIAWDKE
jgi:hypothetical protein